MVEDNQLVGEFATQLLEDVGYGTMWAPNAQAALDLINEKPDRFDVVFTDVVMPGMSGIELARAAREVRPNLPVLLTSGYVGERPAESEDLALIDKPYERSALASRLREVLTAKPVSPKSKRRKAEKATA